MLFLELESMGCRGRAVLDAEGPHARAALDRLPAWLADRERILSRFDPSSALARLNARGRAEHVDEVLWSALDVALAAAASTDGLVTPAVLSALEAAGYDRTFAALPRDRHGAVPPAPVVSPFDLVERDPRTRSVRLPPGLRLDLGGTAKGWSADAAASMLAVVGPALVDLGGDVATGGAPRERWPIAIADPRADAGDANDEPLPLVLLGVGGIATSGRDFRRWMRSGVEQHHVIDPRTGVPARTDVWSATVIARSALDAEIAAKRVLIEGSDRGLAWLETRPELAALVVRDDGSVRRSARFDEHVWKEAA